MTRHLSRPESAQLGLGLLTVAATFAAFAIGSASLRPPSAPASCWPCCSPSPPGAGAAARST